MGWGGGERWAEDGRAGALASRRLTTHATKTGRAGGRMWATSLAQRKRGVLLFLITVRDGGFFITAHRGSTAVRKTLIQPACTVLKIRKKNKKTTRVTSLGSIDFSR